MMRGTVVVLFHRTAFWHVTGQGLSQRRAWLPSSRRGASARGTTSRVAKSIVGALWKSRTPTDRSPWVLALPGHAMLYADAWKGSSAGNLTLCVFCCCCCCARVFMPRDYLIASTLADCYSSILRYGGDSATPSPGNLPE